MASPQSNPDRVPCPASRVLTLLEEKTQAVDAVVLEHWARIFGGVTGASCALAAVGGYGRRELFPYSDVDLLVLVPSETEIPACKEQLSVLLTMLWDSSLRVSHSVRTVAECCRFHPGNLELNISLLDVRFITGNRLLFEDLGAKLPEAVKRMAGDLTKKLVEMTQQRHAKFNNTPYHLEPNVKESPGGLRDLHVIRWLALIKPDERFLADQVTGLNSDQTADERTVDRLYQLRYFLHQRARRDTNLLTFEMQDEAARSLPDSPASPEVWMRLYYHSARLNFQRCQRALEFAGSEPLSILTHWRGWRRKKSGAAFYAAKERVRLAADADPFRSGADILRLFSFVGQLGAPLAWDAHWAVEQNLARIGQSFRELPPAWSDWEKFFTLPDTALALSEMQATGVLAAAIPQWQSIDSLVVRDFYHRYTVDEHTLVAIREIDRLAAGGGDEHQRFQALAQEDGPSAVVRLALLLHDLGKGTTPGNHLRGSRTAAREIMNTMGVPDASQIAVQFLIQHHLDLSILMNGRDLDDPATARSLTSVIQTHEDLRRLTLLTFADISAVNPTAMSPWRAEQLWRVYTLGVQQLTWELASDRIHETPGQFQEGRPPRLLEYLEGFPKRYIRTHSREEIERHLQMAGEARREGVAVDITEQSGAYLITVLAYDKSGLFASLCGTLASFGMSIVKGEASSNASKIVLDLIRFTDPTRTLELNPEEIGRLEQTVRQVVLGSADVTALLRKRRPVRRLTPESTIVPSVRFHQAASDHATLIDFVGEDRPGLLFDLATAINDSGCNIEVVVIDTEAHKALDVFYVTYQGEKIGGELQARLERGLLKAAWDGAAPELP